jgi:hypothetical protein
MGCPRGEMTGDVREVFRVFMGVQAGAKHLSGNRTSRIISFFTKWSMEVLRCLPIY